MSNLMPGLHECGPEIIRQRVQDAGVVGAGGAGFPTHVKLAAQAEIYLVNAAECEPLLQVDQQLAVLEADAMIRGLLYAMRATRSALPAADTPLSLCLFPQSTGSDQGFPGGHPGFPDRCKL